MVDEVSVTLVRYTPSVAMERYRGIVGVPIENKLVLTAENQCALENMIDVAAVDGWRLPAKKGKRK
jgi:hypothetical protein